MQGYLLINTKEEFLCLPYLKKMLPVPDRKSRENSSPGTFQKDPEGSEHTAALKNKVQFPNK